MATVRSEITILIRSDQVDQGCSKSNQVQRKMGKRCCQSGKDQENASLATRRIKSLFTFARFGSNFQTTRPRNVNQAFFHQLKDI